MKVLLPFVCVVLFVAFTTADTVGGSYHPSYLNINDFHCFLSEFKTQGKLVNIQETTVLLS